jgi:sarcosine oxidase subunit gamma
VSELSPLRQGPVVSSREGVRALAPLARYILRGAAVLHVPAQAAFGVALPTVACRSALTGARAALWLGPDEYLLLAPQAEAAALERALEQALSGLPHSLVDVSHRQVALEVYGSHAATLLNAGCPLSLDANDFPPGACTRTILGKAEIVLWRTGVEAFHLEVWRSFAHYVSSFLAEAAHDAGSA